MASNPAPFSAQAGAASPLASVDRGNDVYAYEPERLEEGVRKHTLSVFVADESGLINRVAGVFARRGANIESLAVGLTTDQALFTIVATGTDGTVANLAKQLAKLVNVRYVEDITDQQHIARELVLLKVAAPPGPARTEIPLLAQIFRARIVDVGEASYTMVVTGDPGKMAALQRALSQFGILELVRTGRVALKRGEAVFTGNDWTAASGALSGTLPLAKPQKRERPKSMPHQGDDVYGGSSDDDEGVWMVQNILDAAYAPETEKFESYILSIDVQDVPGVLNQVTGVISRRGFNVQSLAVGNSETEGMSRITLVVPGDEGSIKNLRKQLLKLVYVADVTELAKVPHVQRELMLVKVKCRADQRGELLDVARVFHGNVCDLSKNTLTMEVVGKEKKMRALQEVLEPYGILEVARTGTLALERESGVDTKYLEGLAGTRVML